VSSLLILLVPLLLLLVSQAFSALVEYQWWKEVGQTQTWFNLLLYGVAPEAAAGLLAAVLLWIALARGLKFGGFGLGSSRRLAQVSVLVALVVGLMLASMTIDSWTVIRYLGSQGLVGEATAWQDPVFQKPLAFYLFSLPLYRSLYGYVLALAILAALVYWLAARGAQLREQLPSLRTGGDIELTDLRLQGGLESRFLRFAAVLVLVALAIRFYLSRYSLVLSDHSFMVGVDYVDENVRLPLLWLYVGACLIGAAGVAIGRWRAVLLLVPVYVLNVVAPWAVSTLYVRPNEITLQRPYVAKHIEATRAAYGLNRRVTEIEYAAKMETKVDVVKNKPLLENVRLWDWRAFHDTVTQIQALRPYYVFADSDVDRYTIDGQLRQVMLTPRELDIRQLPEAQRRWINPHFIYTHGYGMVMAEANQITAEGMPVLFVQDAPAKIKTDSLKLTRPEIYYGESTHEPVFVRTEQREFSYPAGNDSVFTRYEGTGGFPIASGLLRIAAAVREVDFNILLTNQFSADSRMMIRRRVKDRLETVAGFLHWDSDPYLVVTDEGHLVWTVDGYTTSDAHPYSQLLSFQGRRLNYMRNSVKATVDAYHGTINLYIADPADPIIQAYSRLFPTLFKPITAMPDALRRHLRYPEAFFRVQAEIYRNYHMRDPQAFYNKEDVWDVARNVQGRDSTPQMVPPTYVLATLPGESEPEFLLILPFTPRNKDNLIGLMAARCDGEKLGELRFLQLSKQALIFGPMQIEARINQDPNISKDLSLWSREGSEVLRGQMLVLPLDETFVYIEPIYIQAREARMPQLKKVVVAVGNQLIYRDTYEEALAELSATNPDAVRRASTEQQPAATPDKGAAPVSQAAPPADNRIAEIRQRLRRYRELLAQGKYAEAGKELEAVEMLTGR
jgi:uncharacterized membrane protein (UPF0182 family)